MIEMSNSVNKAGVLLELFYIMMLVVANFIFIRILILLP
jgi:hypothetical protein